MNTATHDQLQAAESEARRLVQTLERTIGGHTFGDRDLSERLIAKLVPEGFPDACPHALRGGPRPLFITTARVGFALCLHCHTQPAEVRRRQRHTKTRDCDACGEDAEAFYEATLKVGPYILGAHVCVACRDKVVGP